MKELDVLKRFRDDVPEPSTDAWLRARAAIATVSDEVAGPPKRQHSVPSRSRHPRRVVAVLGACLAAALVTASVLWNDRAPSAPIADTHSKGSSVVQHPAPTLIRARVVDALSGGSDTILYTRSSIDVPGQPTRKNQEWDYPWDGQPGKTVQEAGSSSIGGTTQNEWSLSFTIPPASTTTSPDSGVACNVSAQRIDVSFTDQTWQSSQQSCVASTPGLNTTLAFVDPKTHQDTSNIKTLVAQGLLQVAGYPTLSGEPTVELKSNTQGASTLDLWVSANTYLPLQSVTTGPTGDPNPGQTESTVDQYSFLDPTPANRANLQVTVPSGFREVVSSGKG
jgi:hypothetical protein